MSIIDFHVHAFPDHLAGHAIAALEAETPEVRARLDGRVSSLLASMDAAGIARSVVCSIATRPPQFAPILKWSESIRSERIEPFPSVHPRDPEALDRVRQVRDKGFHGLKLHPYYQDFSLDEPALTPFFRTVADLGLILVCHTGFDVAFPRVRRADPRQIGALLRDAPGLRLVTTHMGAWEDWAEVRRRLLGRPVYMDLSYTRGYLPDAELREMILAHPPDRVLFGTDSPWQAQAAELAAFRGLGLGEPLERAILAGNASRLLGDAA